MTDRELLLDACYVYEALAGLGGMTDKHREAYKKIRARLEEPPKDLELPLVRPDEFVKLIQGKENYWGRPVMRCAWPMPEPVIQARKEGDLIVADLPQVPRGSGGISKDEQPEPILPGGGIGRHPDIPIKVQDEREERMPKLTREELLQQTLGRYAKRMENLLYELNAQVVESKLIASEPEPVAWMNPNEESDGYAFSHTYWEGGVFTVPLYTAPKKEWVGLTDEEIEGAIDDGFAFGLDDGNVSNKYVIRYARTIEAKLREKNT